MSIAVTLSSIGIYARDLPEENPTVKKIESVMLAMSAGYRNPINKPEYRKRLATAFYNSGKTHGVDYYLLAVMSFHESGYRSGVESKSKLRERGLLQTHGLAARGCDFSTPEGEIDCGAKWLKKCYDMCEEKQPGLTEDKKTFRAVSAYATGRCEVSKKKSFKAWWRINRRIRDRMKMEELIK